MSQEPAPIVLDAFQEQLAGYLRAMMPFIWIQTYEEDRAIKSLTTVLQRLGQLGMGNRRLTIWSDASIREMPVFQDEKRTPGDKPKVEKDYQEFAFYMKAFGEPDKTDKNQALHEARVLAIADPANALAVFSNCRILKETIEQVKKVRKTVVLLGDGFKLPRELQTQVAVIPFLLPTTNDIEFATNNIINAFKGHKDYEKLTFKSELVKPFARACTGISMEEMRAIISLSIATYSGFDERAIELAMKEKERIVRRSNVLECMHTTGGMSKVGGLENVKTWVARVAPIWNDPQRALDYGLRVPSGLLFLGPPGSGKSLSAKQLASEWRVPLIRLDFGRVFNSLVGASEANLREVFRIVEAVAPCVLLVDELEKAVGGDSNDSGTSERIFGAFLTWMEEKPDNVFVVGTANDLRKLAKRPELIARFADSFFVDLPDRTARIEILNLHLLPRHSLPADSLSEIATALHGYSGREIRNVVNKALAEAFKQNLKHPTPEILLEAAKATVPVSKTMRESIDSLRSWCAEGRAISAGSALEDPNKGPTGDLSAPEFRP